LSGRNSRRERFQQRREILRAIWANTNPHSYSNTYTYFHSDSHANGYSNTCRYAEGHTKAAPHSAPASNTAVIA
jgi:hypothetical protein